MAYILSVNAALRLMKEYYAHRAGVPAPSTTAALYRVNYIKTAFGGQKLWREVQSTAPVADGAYYYSSHGYYQDGGVAEDVNYVNRCGLQMLGVVVMPGEKETLFLADFHNNSAGPAPGAHLLINEQEVVVPLGLEGFGDAFVYFALDGVLTPKAVRLTEPVSPVVRVGTVRGRWTATPSEVGLNAAVAQLHEMRHLTPADVVKEPCRPAAPARGNAAPPPKKAP
jgi:hypothetical protein